MPARLKLYFSLLLILFVLTPFTGRAADRADLNRDGVVDLTDVLLGLQVVAGTTPTLPEVAIDIDVDSDGKIGMAEVLHVLGTAQANHRAALAGPLTNAAVSAVRATNGEVLASGIITGNSPDLPAAGTFALPLPGVADDEWVLVSISGGADLDANSDGVADATPTASQGTLHALARAADWRTKSLRVTPLTELAWRYVEHLIAEVPSEDVPIRLQDIARNLVKTDLDASGVIDWYDLLAFDPANPAHRPQLATNYDWLATPDEDGVSILGSLRSADEPAMLARMDAVYSFLMTRFPVPDSRYHSVKIALAVFGPGRAAAGAPHTLAVDSTLAAPILEDSLYAAQDDSTTLTLTATPGPDARILSWTGCDAVSADLGQCVVPLNRSQSVMVNFGRNTTQLTGTVHDLSRTLNIVGFPDAAGNSTVSVNIPEDMADMIAEMAAAAAGDFVVGPNGGGFLRRITAITQLSPTSYKLDTVEAALDEVIAQGTGHLFRQLENGDLEGYVPPPVEGGETTVSATAFTGLKGVTLEPSAEPADRTFTLTLGAPPPVEDDGEMQVKSLSQETSAEVVLIDYGDGHKLSASGKITLDISLDTGFDYKLLQGLEAFKLIAIADANEEVALKASYQLPKFEIVKKKLGTLRFAPIAFAIGPVPVWVTPLVDVFLFAEGKVGAEATMGFSFTQRVEGGVLYNRDTGFASHKKLVSDHEPLLPAGAISASLRGGLETSPVLRIYDATGPAVPLEAYLKLEASAETEVFGTCADVLVEFLLGGQASFKWDLSGSSKFGQMLHLDQLEEQTEFAIFTQEWLIKRWTLADTCPDYVQGSHLLVKGDGLVKTIDQGYTGNLATTLTVVNTGDQPLSWNTASIPTEVLVSPSSGTLAPGAETLVQLSLATAGLPAGRYQKKVFFYNQASVGQNLPDDQFGNTWKSIDVQVLPPITATPVLTGATSPAVGQARLNWTFNPGTTTPFIGFQVYATTTPENLQSYRLVRTVSIAERSVTLSGLTPGATYSFDLRACSNSGAPGPFSNKLSLAIAGTLPAFALQSFNDTGITWGGNYPEGNNTTCTSNVDAPQDCHQGRDATHNDPSDGQGGFSYTKLDANGNSLPAAATTWSCVRDNVTGLVWEVKTDDGTIHDKDNTYRWGGTTALGAGYGTYYPDWNSLVDGSNSQRLCGFSDWRVPNRAELQGLVHYGRTNPAIDTDYFPNTPASHFWSASPYGSSSSNAWHVNFSNGGAYDYYGRSGYSHVRLVRSGQ